MSRQPIEPARATGRVSPTAPESKSISAAVWDHLEAQPGFSKRIERGQAQIARGEKVLLSEVLRRR